MKADKNNSINLEKQNYKKKVYRKARNSSYRTEIFLVVLSLIFLGLHYLDFEWDEYYIRQYFEGMYISLAIVFFVYAVFILLRKIFNKTLSVNKLLARTGIGNIPVRTFEICAQYGFEAPCFASKVYWKDKKQTVLCIKKLRFDITSEKIQAIFEPLSRLLKYKAYIHKEDIKKNIHEIWFDKTPDQLFIDDIPKPSKPYCVPIALNSSVEWVEFDYTVANCFDCRGSTGSGKSFAVLSVLRTLLDSEVRDCWGIYIVDPKTPCLYETVVPERFKSVVKVFNPFIESDLEGFRDCMESIDLHYKALENSQEPTSGFYVVICDEAGRYLNTDGVPKEKKDLRARIIKSFETYMSLYRSVAWPAFLITQDMSSEGIAIPNQNFVYRFLAEASQTQSRSLVGSTALFNKELRYGKWLFVSPSINSPEIVRSPHGKKADIKNSLKKK